MNDTDSREIERYEEMRKQFDAYTSLRGFPKLDSIETEFAWKIWQAAYNAGRADAFKRAVEICREEETRYKLVFKERMSWACDECAAAIAREAKRSK